MWVLGDYWLNKNARCPICCPWVNMESFRLLCCSLKTNVSPNVKGKAPFWHACFEHILQQPIFEGPPALTKQQLFPDDITNFNYKKGTSSSVDVFELFGTTLVVQCFATVYYDNFGFAHDQTIRLLVRSAPAFRTSILASAIDTFLSERAFVTRRFHTWMSILRNFHMPMHAAKWNISFQSRMDLPTRGITLAPSPGTLRAKNTIASINVKTNKQKLHPNIFVWKIHFPRYTRNAFFSKCDPHFRKEAKAER